MKSCETLIIGGGLSGLALAWMLSRRNRKATVLEGSSRLGGRIQTVKGLSDTPMELGATWFSEMHPELIALISELGLTKFPQFSKGKSLFQTKSFEPPQAFFVPEAENPSYRIAGGTQALIDALAEKLDFENIVLNAFVSSIKETESGLLVETTEGKKWNAEKVIICIPPQLASSSISFVPALSEETQQLLPNVQTWMAGAIKFVVEYKDCFWRQAGYSGMLYSHAGIIMEMYDHTNFEECKFGFTGFLNGGAANYSQEVRRDYVLRQLAELLGEKSLEPLMYLDKIWRDEYILSENQNIYMPHQNHGHSLLQESHMSGRLYFGATETSGEFAGYMEGAVRSAKSILEKL